MSRFVESVFMIFAGCIFGFCMLDSGPAEPIELPASSTCENQACKCEDCKCDQCECKAEAMAVDERPIIYFFTSNDCVYCDYMKPDMESIKADGYRLVEMNIDDAKWSEYAKFYNVKETPQTVKVDHEGHELSRIIGMTSKDSVLGMSTSKPVQSSVSVCVNGTCGPATASRAVMNYRPQRTGWFRGSSVRSCGPGGCR